MVACPVDEEGMMLGIRHLIERGWVDEVDAAIVCEPEENQICVAQKGAIRARVLVTGVMAHGAMPLTGLNPVPVSAELISRLGVLESDEIDRLGYDEMLGWPSLTPTVVRAPVAGEGQLNVVPESAELLIDIRTVVDQDHPPLIEALLDLCAGLELDVRAEVTKGRGAELRERLRPGLGEGLEVAIDLDVLDDRPWTHTDRREPIVQAVDRAVREVTGREPVYNGVPGATDGTFLWALRDIPIVTTGAGDRFVPHKRDEWVDLHELHETALIYRRAALDFLGRASAKR